MDITIEGFDASLPDIEADKNVMDIKDAGERLLRSVPGLAVIDSDFTLKTKEYELGNNGNEPGRMPDESIELLQNLKEKGWQILVVSNQPEEGHQVARTVRKLKGGNYPIFPDTLKQVLGKENVNGGGKDFLWNKYKDTQKAVDKTANWILEHSDLVVGQVYFLGDRDSDMNFGKKVGDVLKEEGFGRAVNTWKIRGFELPRSMKFLEKLIP